MCLKIDLLTVGYAVDYVRAPGQFTAHHDNSQLPACCTKPPGSANHQANWQLCVRKAGLRVAAPQTRRAGESQATSRLPESTGFPSSGFCDSERVAPDTSWATTGPAMLMARPHSTTSTVCRNTKMSNTMLAFLM